MARRNLGWGVLTVKNPVVAPDGQAYEAAFGYAQVTPVSAKGPNTQTAVLLFASDDTSRRPFAITLADQVAGFVSTGPNPSLGRHIYDSRRSR